MPGIPAIDAVTATVMGFTPYTVTYMKKSFLDYRRGRRIQVTDLR